MEIYTTKIVVVCEGATKSIDIPSEIGDWERILEVEEYKTKWIYSYFGTKGENKVYILLMTKK